MKILNLTSILLIGLFAFNTHSTNYKFIETDNNVEEKICILAANNNRLGLENALKIYTWGNTLVTKRFAINNIVCNGMVMAHFAHKYNAPNTFAYLNSLTHSKNKITSTNVKAVINNKNGEGKIIYVSASE